MDRDEFFEKVGDSLNRPLMAEETPDVVKRFKEECEQMVNDLMKLAVVEKPL